MNVRNGIDAGLHQGYYRHQDLQISQVARSDFHLMIGALPNIPRLRDTMMYQPVLAVSVLDAGRYLIRENRLPVRT